MDRHEGAIMALAHPEKHGNTGGEQHTSTTVPPEQHAGSVVFLELVVQDHSAVQEGGGVETTEFGGGLGKVSDLKGV